MTTAQLLVCDDEGNIFEHPELLLAGQTGREFVPVSDEELVEVPEGTKVFYLPGSYAVGWDQNQSMVRVDRRFRAVAGMLQAGYTRTYLPAVSYPAEGPPKYGDHDYLPLWAYCAVGWGSDGMVGAAFRSDPMEHSQTCHYDDREIAPKVEKKLAADPDNRLKAHLSRCALEYHCFAAKNLFMERWEAPLPTAPGCNAGCLGCISEQPADCCPSSQDRIGFVPTVEELCGVAVPHLEKVDRAIVSFGQGCEGEPLIQGDRIAEAVRAFRQRTNRGTVHLNTNGSLPGKLGPIIDAGLDSVRISLNSCVASTYERYYRPRGYVLSDVFESIKISVDRGLYVSLNLLVFPGVSDLPAETEAVERLVESTGLNMIHFRNLSIDPRLYLDNLPAELFDYGPPMGLKKMAVSMKRRFPKLDIGYFNRPREEFDMPMVDIDFLLNG